MKNDELGSAVARWLTSAVADAERRGLPSLAPLLETLARSTAALRAADAELRPAAGSIRDAVSRISAGTDDRA